MQTLSNNIKHLFSDNCLKGGYHFIPFATTFVMLTN